MYLFHEIKYSLFLRFFLLDRFNKMTKCLETFVVLKKGAAPVTPLLQFEFEDLLTSVKRKMTIKPRLNNPWGICAEIKIHKSLFLKWFRAVRDYKIRSHREIVINKYKNAETKNIIITYDHKSPLCYHLGQVMDGEYIYDEFSIKYFSPGLMVWRVKW